MNPEGVSTARATSSTLDCVRETVSSRLREGVLLCTEVRHIWSAGALQYKRGGHAGEYSTG